ncbi:unnamed protein product [Ambrosiozyma monospora]|uniref:Unnamed protein product n=1 Tax=Ambrosiozyma monospora TaxID=43982 RepID=A0ACB5U381_AMBMO|nr:unnamed protein product [Ambrosiozyma monospora]
MSTSPSVHQNLSLLLNILIHSVSSSSSTLNSAQSDVYITLTASETIASVSSFRTVYTSSSGTSSRASKYVSPSSSASSNFESEYTDCSPLSGKAQAQCLNKNYGAGLYNGSADSCEAGEISCSPEGDFAICNQGSWVKMPCGDGSTCYAYTSGGSVESSCNYESQKSSFTKRDSALGGFFKRGHRVLGHKHHQH